MPTRRRIKRIKIIQGDCRDKLTEIATESIHLIVTDPPYFLDGLDCDWKNGRADAPKGTGTVGGLPVGMSSIPSKVLHYSNSYKRLEDRCFGVWLLGVFVSYLFNHVSRIA